MKRVDIWTIHGDHLVFENVLWANPSTNGERFFLVRRETKIDYVPWPDIRRVTVTDQSPEKVRGQNKRFSERTKKARI